MDFRKLHGIKLKKKCHYMCIGRNIENDKFKFDNLLLENSKEEVVLGITIDNKLTFDSHILKIFVEKPTKTWCIVKDNKLS